MVARPLTERQRKFVEAYMKTGNATEAARLSGYKNANTQGPRLLVKEGIQDAIANRVAADSEVWDRRRLLKFWTDMAQSAEGDNNRLKASEYLGKAQAMFTQKIEAKVISMTSEEVDELYIADLRSRGYKVVAP